MANKNIPIKQYAAEKGVYLWELGLKFGKSDSNFSRRLRTEFTPEELEEAKRYVDQIAAERS